jgi:hypothetical protein
MLSLVKYKGNHVGRTVMAVKCSNGEIIPLICDTAEEDAPMLCRKQADRITSPSRRKHDLGARAI